MKKLLALTLLLTTAPLKAVVILVHGTFAMEEGWCRPGGKFYDELKIAAGDMGESLIPFVWTGKLTDEARLNGAYALYELIMSYPPDEEITFVAHSHGGNIVNLVSHLLQDPRKVKFSLGHLLSDAFLNSLPPLTRKATFLGIGARIKAAYYLGTPVMDKPYKPNMNVIERLFNCYSKGDNIQTGLGLLYDRKIKGHERISNLSITLQGSKPSHSDLHHYKVARWLFDTPQDITDCKVHIAKNGDVTYEAKKS